MEASELAKRYDMQPHEEGGTWCALGQLGEPGQRAESGAIYYCLQADEVSQFHQIDCNEYWAWHAGTALEMWFVYSDGSLDVKLLGTSEDAEPLVAVPKGTVFGARHLPGDQSGEATFLSCITAPGFEYSGWRLVDKEEVTHLCPAAAAFGGADISLDRLCGQPLAPS
ncbi:MAG: cupin domain-containing protein, partial [Coriobacteriia bacterium]|nr:cupin domain-containing protein [Coriobacteriia bacterium]